MSPPAPGSAPMNTPIVEQRNDSGRYFFSSAHDGMILVTSWRTGVILSECSCTSTSETPKKPIIAATYGIPPVNSTMP